MQFAPLSHDHSHSHLPGTRPELQKLSYKDIATETLPDAITVFKQCFELETDRKNAEASYTRLANGEKRLFSSYHNDWYEYVQSSVFYVNDRPVGIGGIYRVDNQPDRVFLGWFGVIESERGNIYPVAGKGDIKISDFILGEMATATLLSGARYLSLFTEDGQQNSKIQKYYERRGFVQTGILESAAGERERVYVLDLAATSGSAE